MLDERLIGDTFSLPVGDTVTLYGIHYHFRVLDDALPHQVVVIVGVTPLGLDVRRRELDLKY